MAGMKARFSIVPCQRQRFLAALLIIALWAADHHQITSASENDNKCGGCPCGNPCVQSPPTPSLPPPAPVLPPPPPPPPHHHHHDQEKPTPYCPPPPPPYSSSSSNPVYLNGPPGNLYPVVDHPYSGTIRDFGPAPLAAALVWWGVHVLLLRG